MTTESQPAAPAPTASSAQNGAPPINVFRRVYRELTAEEQKLVGEVKDLAHALHSKLQSLNPSREVSIAKTKVEEAVFWAVKHITG